MMDGAVAPSIGPLYRQERSRLGTCANTGYLHDHNGNESCDQKLASIDMSREPFLREIPASRPEKIAGESDSERGGFPLEAEGHAGATISFKEVMKRIWKLMRFLCRQYCYWEDSGPSLRKIYSWAS